MPFFAKLSIYFNYKKECGAKTIVANKLQNQLILCLSFFH